MVTKKAKRKWNWVKYTDSVLDGEVAKMGCLKLEVWEDEGDVYFVAFDVKNGNETASDFAKPYKTKRGAKNAAERMAEKWLASLHTALVADAKK